MRADSFLIADALAMVTPLRLFRGRRGQTLRRRTFPASSGRVAGPSAASCDFMCPVFNASHISNIRSTMLEDIPICIMAGFSMAAGALPVGQIGFPDGGADNFCRFHVGQVPRRPAAHAFACPQNPASRAIRLIPRRYHGSRSSAAAHPANRTCHESERLNDADLWEQILHEVAAA